MWLVAHGRPATGNEDKRNRRPLCGTKMKLTRAKRPLSADGRRKKKKTIRKLFFTSWDKRGAQSLLLVFSISRQADERTCGFFEIIHRIWKMRKKILFEDAQYNHKAIQSEVKRAMWTIQEIPNVQPTYAFSSPGPIYQRQTGKHPRNRGSYTLTALQEETRAKPT